jgi:hypothetical protein
VIVLAAFAPAGAAPLLAILSSLCLFLFVVVTHLISDDREELQRPNRPFLPVLASRPPPVA